MQSFAFLRDFGRDLCHAVRSWRRTPSYFAGAALVLALGTGATCAISNLVYAVLLRPLPYSRPDAVVMLWSGSVANRHLSSGMIRHWRESSAGVFSDFAIFKLWETQPDARFDLVRPDTTERVRGALVTPNFFSVLGTRAVLGRVFTAGDERDAGDPVVLSEAFWRRHFSGDASAIGTHIRLNTGPGASRVSRMFTVIGVLPAAFRFTYPLETEIWAVIPWRVVDATSPYMATFGGGVARLATGVSPTAAEAVLAIRPAAAVTGDDRALDQTRVQPIAEHVSGNARPSIYLLAAVSMLLVTMACATVANLVLVRTTERKHELAVRVALGAGRWRLTRQLLTEGFLLVLAGTLAGATLTVLLLPVFRSIIPAVLPRGDEMAIRWGLLAIPSAVLALVTLVTLLVPAIQGSSPQVSEALKNTCGTVAGRRSRFAFVALQSATATVLVIAGTLLLTSYWRLNHVNLGFDGKDVLAAEIQLTGEQWAGNLRDARFQEELIRRVRALPGVTKAGLTSTIPFFGWEGARAFRRSPERQWIWGAERYVDATYFSILGLSLLRGRLFTDLDNQSSEPVAVVSNSFADRLYPGEDPIDQKIYLGIDEPVPVRIVGIVNDARYRSQVQDPLPDMYRPQAQVRQPRLCVLVRTSGNRENVAAALRRAVHEIDPTVPVLNIATIDQILADSNAGRLFYTSTAVIFGVLALVLTATGLIAVVTRSISERRRELAIRAAVGASGGRLVAEVVHRGLAPVIVGVPIGLAAAWLGGRILEGFLFGVTLHSPALYLGAALFMVLVGALACLFPARQAGRVSPATELKGS